MPEACESNPRKPQAPFSLPPWVLPSFPLHLAGLILNYYLLGMQFTTAHDLRLREADELERRKQFGPPPVNPFSVLRTASGLTLGDLSAYSRIDKRALSRCEAGMYVSPLPSLVSYWVTRGKATEGQLLNDYADFIDAQRARHYRYFGPLLNTSGNVHPMRELRRRRPTVKDPLVQLPVGITECCQALCLPMDSIQFFEKKFRLQQSVPKVLINALNQIGYTRRQIDRFEDDYAEWRSKAKEVTFS